MRATAPTKFSVMSAAEVVGVIAVCAGLVAVAVAGSAALTMILWGAIASAVGAPTIGFGTAIVVNLLAGLLTGSTRIRKD